MRQFTWLGLTLLATLLALPLAAGAAELVIQTWGSQVTEAEAKAFYDSFESATGIKVVKVVSTADARAKLEAQVRSGNVEWDMISGFPGSSILTFARRGLLEPIDYTKVPGAKALPADARWPYGVGTEVDAVVLTSTAKLPPERRPQTWVDFFNAEKFPGPRMMSNWGAAWTNVAIALMADGVPREKLVPMDLDRAFRKLDQVKPHVRVWFKSGAQQIQAFADGEVQICACWDGRMHQARQQGVPLEFSWQDAIQYVTYWAIVKGAKNRDAAHRFLEWTTDPKRQSVFTEIAFYSTTHPRAVEYLPAEDRKNRSMFPANRQRVVVFDEKEMEWIMDNLQTITERWNLWVSK